MFFEGKSPSHGTRGPCVWHGRKPPFHATSAEA